jgi:hypothetical protein
LATHIIGVLQVGRYDPKQEMKGRGSERMISWALDTISLQLMLVLLVVAVVATVAVASLLKK